MSDDEHDALFGVGTIAPSCAIMSGRLVIDLAPGLVHVVDPEKVYFVSREGIVELEE